jgi:hypothetical protein
MPEIEEKYLQNLRDKNLFVSKSYPAGHVYENGIWIAKPTAIPGNSIPGYDGVCGKIPIDAPAVMLYPTKEGWVVLNQEHVPVLGPGDFKNVWQTVQEAVDDIVDFYFGNPERMMVINNRIASHR